MVWGSGFRTQAEKKFRPRVIFLRLGHAVKAGVMFLDLHLREMFLRFEHWEHGPNPPVFGFLHDSYMFKAVEGKKPETITMHARW